MKALRLIWTLIAALCSLSLMGMDSSPFPAPSVVVYPLTGTGGTPAEAGGNVAILLSSKLAELGGLVVKPYTPGTQRTDYLSAAIGINADYYITGYLTPVGNDVSLIVQVVSTQSGSVIYSSSATVQTYSDVVAQADPLRAAILHHAGRGLPSVGQVAEATTPAPIASSGSVNLTRALGRHSRQASPTPTPLPSPSASATSAVVGVVTPSPSASPAPAQTASPHTPSSRRAISRATATPAATASPSVAVAPSVAPSPVTTVVMQFPNVAKRNAGKTTTAQSISFANGLVVDVDGDAPPEQRTHAQIALAQAITRGALRGEILHVSSTDAQHNAAALCAANAGAAAFFIDTLTSGDGTIQLSVMAQGCNGTTTAQTQITEHTSGRGGVMAAIDRAAAADAIALSAAIAPVVAPKP